MVKQVLRLLAAFGILFGSAAFADEYRLGSKVGDFPFQDLKGNSVTFSQLRGDVTVVIFISTRCPVSNSYNDRMNALYKDYAAKNVHFIFINANKSESVEEIAHHAEDHSFAFPVYKDLGNVIADRFAAQVTPEAFVIDSTGMMRYHGCIDDSMKTDKIRTQGLRRALDSLISGKPVDKAETKAFGCTIQRR